MLCVDIFFNLRGVHGDTALANGLRAHAFDMAKGQKAFIKLLVESAGAVELGLNFFGSFRTDKGRIELKRLGLFGIVTAARALAIRYHKTIGKYMLPPPGARSPALWGTPARIDELFGPHAASMESAQRNFVFRYRSPEHWLEVFKTYYGPLLKTFAALDVPARSALASDLTALIDRFNRSAVGSMVVPSEYLEVVITRD